MINTALPLEFLDVYKSYPRVEALKGVSFSVPTGQIVGLVGPNGSGKSTLLKIAAGLLRARQGEVRIMGRVPGRATKAQVAYMPEVDHLYRWMTVRQTLDFVAAFFPDWEAERAAELMELLELPDRPVGQLSKGQRARVRLILAFARSAPLVLLDEPLSGIDPPSRTRIVKGILAGFRHEQQAVVLSTHEILETESLFDRVLALASGKIVLDAPGDELRASRGQSLQAVMEEVLA